MLDLRQDDDHGDKRRRSADGKPIPDEGPQVALIRITTTTIRGIVKVTITP
ncbi:hypothetical protein [Microvirga sp. BSC39]|uniref:hypothetical protein n=1 Tax=Microvirga sp. BSC39 TaxID=1549810 RepID=UPI000AC0B294|nr:hypothetical protein [Microvirga sp. BSC39]